MIKLSQEKFDYEKIYSQEVTIFNNISSRYEMLQENDIASAYTLMRDSLQAYNRWSKIKYDIKKDLGRGQATALKSRFDEICKYLKEVHTTSRVVWGRAKDDMRNTSEVI